jgi:magnesium transporter
MFILKGDVLVTVRYAAIRPFENVVEKAARPGGQMGSSGEPIMLALLEALVDRLADSLEQIGDGIDAISRGVFRTKPGASKSDRDLQAAIEQVGRQGDLLGLVRESLVSINRLISYHEGTGHLTRSSAESEARAGSLLRDVVALADHASYLGSKISFLLDATLGLINLEQNQIIKLFSIAAVCLMPPTLVASIYGMNFKNIPELDFTWGYPMALVMMLITGIAPYLYFRKRGWL